MNRTRTPLLTVSIASQTDLLVARRRTTEISGLLGMDRHDQTRIATAISEIVRNAYNYAGGGKVEFHVDRATPLALRVLVQDRGPGIPHLDSIWAGTYRSTTGMGLGMIGARRLVDGFDVASGADGTTVTLLKHLSTQGTKDLPPDAELLKALSMSRASDTTSVLVEQNQELMQLLDQLRQRETDLKRLNQELEETNRGVMVLYSELEDKAKVVQQANDMKTRFLSSVTHELRTPLNSIVSLSRLLQGRTDGELSPEQDKQVGFILRSAQNLTELVNDLLDLAKAEAGKLSVHLVPCSVADIFSVLRGMFRPIAQNEDVELRVQMPAGDLQLVTDEGKLSQILRNFLSNALKFTEQGEVVLSAEQVDGAIVFCVSDTGVGIAPEHRELVLQEWAQVETSRNSKHRGSGLGLPLAKKFTELLGGEMWFDSALGKGSQFYIRLPLGSLPESMRAAPSPEAKEAVIVVVDDDEVARYLLRRQLSVLTSARILEAIRGEEGLQLIRTHKPTFAVLDLVMPEMNGLEIATAVRQDPELNGTHLLVITSKVLTAAEQALLAELDIEVLGRKGISDEEQRVVLERALLEVGLNNLHLGSRP